MAQYEIYCTVCLGMVECHAFLEEHMNVELDYDGIGCDYEIKIPQSIVDMAF